MVERSHCTTDTLAILENAHGPDYPIATTALGNRAGLFRAEGRDAPYEELLRCDNVEVNCCEL